MFGCFHIAEDNFGLSLLICSYGKRIEVPFYVLCPADMILNKIAEGIFVTVCGELRRRIVRDREEVIVADVRCG